MNLKVEMVIGPDRSKVVNELRKSDPEFCLLIEKNRELLQNNKLKITVYKEGRNILGTHALSLKGTIKANGFGYLSALKTESFLLPFSKSLYPVRIEGEIDELGNISLKVTKRKFQFLGGRVPKEFLGQVEVDGKITAELVSSEFEFYGDSFMSNLIFDPFNGNEESRLEYLSNLKKLNLKIDSLNIE